MGIITELEVELSDILTKVRCQLFGSLMALEDSKVRACHQLFSLPVIAWQQRDNDSWLWQHVDKSWQQ